MNSRTLKTIRPFWLAIGVIFLVCSLLAGGIAQSVRFQQALPGYQYRFPRDHAAHEAFKTEWWYYTGHLKAENGDEYGYELTFFRSANPSDRLPKRSAWQLKNVYMAHFALSDKTRQRFGFWEKLNRRGVGTADALSTRYHVWNENWSARLTGNQHKLQAKAPGTSLDLTLISEKPPVIHGRNGISRKATCPGCASHYYSLTRMKTQGTLTQNGRRLRVAGTSWMDHEFGSNQLGRNQAGWDWFSIQLDNGTEWMLYILRDKNGQPDPNSSGTVVYPDGRSRHLTIKDFRIRPLARWKSPKTGAVYPIRWQLQVPRESLTLEVRPVFAGQELVLTRIPDLTYWEGAADVQGDLRKRLVRGHAYVEMTGYYKGFGRRTRF